MILKKRNPYLLRRILIVSVAVLLVCAVALNIRQRTSTVQTEVCL